MLPDPPRRGLEGILYVLTLMLRHQAVVVLPLLLGLKHTVLHLPAPCPLPIAPHDFSKRAQLVELGYATAKPFLDGLRIEGPGIYGHPHFQSAMDTPATAVAVDEAMSVESDGGSAQLTLVTDHADIHSWRCGPAPRSLDQQHRVRSSPQVGTVFPPRDRHRPDGRVRARHGLPY